MKNAIDIVRKMINTTQSEKDDANIFVPQLVDNEVRNKTLQEVIKRLEKEICIVSN